MNKRKPTYLEAILPFIMLVILVSIGNVILKLRIEIMLTMAAAFTGIIAWRLGYSWSELEEAIGERIKKVTPAILIMWCVGIIIGTFMFSGSIPVLIYYGLKIVNPQYLFVFSFLICMLLSTVTGTAWGSVGTAGVAMIGVAQGLGVPLGITAGAVIGGAIFGDKMSPLSDTTNLSAASAGVDLYEHIKHMLYTTVVATVISLVVYFILGQQMIQGATGLSETAIVMIDTLDKMYNWSILMLLPLLIIFGGAFFKKPTVPTMILGSIVAVFVGVFANGFSLENGVRSAVYGFNVSMLTVPNLDISTISSSISTLVNRGGMRGMIGIIMIIYCGYAYTAILSKIGCIDVAFEPMIKKIKSQGQAMLGAVVSSIILAAAAGTSYVPTIMVPEMFKKIFIENGMKLRNLSRTLEDAGTCVNPLIPWGMSGMFYATTFNMSNMEYIPWAVLCWLTPILAVIYGFTGFGIAKLTEDEKKIAQKNN